MIYRVISGKYQFDTVDLFSAFQIAEKFNFCVIMEIDTGEIIFVKGNCDIMQFSKLIKKNNY